jgi:DNA-binding SARP family transcriptional activator
MVHFGVLGALEVRTDHGVRLPGGAKLRKVLALLLLRANQVVEVETLAEELWDGHPARNGTGTIRTHVYHLRQALARELGTQEVSELLATEPTGYLLRLDPNQLDATRFLATIRVGQDLLERGQIEESARRLREGLSLWRGRALANVSTGAVLSRHIAYLDEMRHHALELRIEADMSLGRHRELVAELRSLIATNPLHEWYHAQLITALYRCGRRGEALLAFHQLRRVLNEELGLEPTEEAQRLQYEILVADGRREAVPAIRRGATRVRELARP